MNSSKILFFALFIISLFACNNSKSDKYPIVGTYATATDTEYSTITYKHLKKDVYNVTIKTGETSDQYKGYYNDASKIIEIEMFPNQRTVDLRFSHDYKTLTYVHFSTEEHFLRIK